MADELISIERLTDYNDNILRDTNVLKRKTSYYINNVINKGQIFLKCIKSGTTSNVALSLAGVQVGDVLDDGTARWQVLSINGVGFSNGLEDWQPYYKYAVGDIFVNEGQIYKTLVGYTSAGTFSNPKIVTTYIPIDWQPNTFYSVGDIFIYGGTFYEVVNDFTSGATFSVTSDIQVYTVPTWTSGVTFEIGDFFEYNNKYYTPMMKFTCGDTFTEIAFAEYVPYGLTDTDVIDIIKAYSPSFVGNDGEPEIDIIMEDWAANTQYHYKDVIVYDAEIYKVMCEYMSGVTFSEDTLLEEYTNVAWTPNTSYTTGELIYYGANDYRVINDFTSGSTFNTTNLELYTVRTWAIETTYNIDDYVTFDSVLYRIIKKFKSSDTFSLTALKKYVPNQFTEQDIKDILNTFNPEFGEDGANTYTDTPKIIGIWVEGSPLYQVSYDTTSPTSNSVESVAVIPAGANVVYIEAHIIGTDGKHIQLAYPYIYVDNTGDIMCQINDINYYNCTMYITIRYI